MDEGCASPKMFLEEDDDAVAAAGACAGFILRTIFCDSSSRWKTDSFYSSINDYKYWRVKGKKYNNKPAQPPPEPSQNSAPSASESCVRFAEPRRASFAPFVRQPSKKTFSQVQTHNRSEYLSSHHFRISVNVGNVPAFRSLFSNNFSFFSKVLNKLRQRLPSAKNGQ